MTSYTLYYKLCSNSKEDLNRMHRMLTGCTIYKNSCSTSCASCIKPIYPVSYLLMKWCCISLSFTSTFSLSSASCRSCSTVVLRCRFSQDSLCCSISFSKSARLFSVSSVNFCIIRYTEVYIQFYCHKYSEKCHL